MDPGFIPRLIRPLLAGEADYTKGNRFFRLEGLRAMPAIRLLGNAVLSFVNKLSSGYWNLFDPTNGFTAIQAVVLAAMPLEKINRGYFFESDMLFRLNTLQAVVMDVPMNAVYGEEQSSMRIGQVLASFPLLHGRSMCKRLFYNYYLRNFSIASVNLLIGLIMHVFGLSFGIVQWVENAALGIGTPAGTVMLAALPVIVGTQLVLSFLAYDIEHVPSVPVHKRLQ
jgi:dolichol-phosphate mannosyltransferase